VVSADLRPDVRVRRDNRYEDDYTVARKQLSHVTDPAHVCCPVRTRETEVGTQMTAQLVAIENL
jgi:hypothetical protein